MACFAVVYGYLECLANDAAIAGLTISSHASVHNLRALQSLPDSDTEYPFLSRHMFAVALPDLEDNYRRGIIRQIVHFGASLKVDPQDQGFVDQWILKFESLVLPRFVWIDAVVHFVHENAGVRTDRFNSNPDVLRSVREELSETGQWTIQKMKWSHTKGSFL